jgi:hypothetical protein
VISRVHQKLGTAGFIISIIALVAALGGGAYAASGGLTGKQKKEVEKIAKKYAGKPGANGATGPVGAAGPAGPKGDAGAAGAGGKQGPEGKQGEEGEPGSPWTAGGTLPTNATETGTWSASGLEGAEVWVPISFSIPLAQVLTEAKTHLVPAGGEGVCNGTSAAPKAPAGELCVYQSEFAGVTSAEIWNTTGSGTGTGKTGAFLRMEGLTSTSQAYGTWAVTGG